MTEVSDEELAEDSVVPLESNPLVDNARGPELTMRDVQLDRAPRGGGQSGHLILERSRASPEGDEGDIEGIELREVGIGRKFRVEHQVFRSFTVALLPELDEAKDLAGLFSLAQVRV